MDASHAEQKLFLPTLPLSCMLFRLLYKEFDRIAPAIELADYNAHIHDDAVEILNFLDKNIHLTRGDKIVHATAASALNKLLHTHATLHSSFALSIVLKEIPHAKGNREATELLFSSLEHAAAHSDNGPRLLKAIRTYYPNARGTARTSLALTLARVEKHAEYRLAAQMAAQKLGINIRGVKWRGRE